MRAFVINELRGPTSGTLTEVAAPAGAHPWTEGQRLLIEVHAAGVSYPDLLQSRGEYQHAPPLPYVSGGEVAGVVREAPPQSGFVAGDRVTGFTCWGGMAEFALGIPEYTVKLPPTMDYVHGAALYLNYATAWFALQRVQFESGETVLVHGASGGVGSAAVQLIEALGGEAIAVVSNTDKERVARDAGARHVARSDGAWLDEVRGLTDGYGVQVVLDPVGGDRFTDSLRALDVGGRLAVIGFAAGEIPTVKANRLLLRDLSVVGVALAPYARRYPGITRALADTVESLAAQGLIEPVIGHRVPLTDGAKALELLERREALGKVIVEVRTEEEVLQ